MIKHDPDKRLTQGWHLDKRISLAHIFTTISLVIALGSVMWAIETRVTLVEQRVSTHEVTTTIELNNIKEADRNAAMLQTERYEGISTQLRRIEDKVDRHSENTVNHGK